MAPGNEMHQCDSPPERPGPLLRMHQDILQTIHHVTQKQHARIYLVGGFVRNCILNLPMPDMDLLVYGDASFCSSLHKSIPSTLICLDRERGIYRLVLKRASISIDVTFEKADTPLEQNLQERDFTINAMAVQVEDLLDEMHPLRDSLIDPFNGREDAEKGTIRMVREENFIHDPLRLCRAFRFGAEFGFSISRDTLRAIARHARLILTVAPERIHEEWGKMMRAARAGPYVRMMQEARLLQEIVPEIIPMEGLDQGHHHSLTLWEHSLTALHYLEEILNNPGQYLPADLKGLALRIASDNPHLLPLLKTAALFHDMGKPEVKDTGKKGQVTFYGHQQKGAAILGLRMDALRFSRAEIRYATALIKEHMRPLYLFQAQRVSARAKTRFFIQVGSLWEELLLLSIADMLATTTDILRIRPYLDFIHSLFLFRRGMEEKVRRSPLISGDELQKMLRFPPGLLMGKALRAIEEAYLSGSIQTKEEALMLAQNFLNQQQGTQK